MSGNTELIRWEITAVCLSVSGRYDFDVVLEHHGALFGDAFNAIEGIEIATFVTDLLSKRQVSYPENIMR